MKTTALLLALLLTACGKKSPAPQPEPPALGSLREAAFPFGAAVNVSLMRSNPSYQAVVTREYRSVTAENAMKFRHLHLDRRRLPGAVRPAEQQPRARPHPHLAPVPARLGHQLFG